MVKSKRQERILELEPLSFPAYGGTVIIMPGEAAAYARKSVAGEGAGKSIDDQIEVCLEVADEVGLPLSQNNDLYRERPGCGGDVWWQGGGGNGLLDLGERQYRPEMTKIMQAICNGTTKAIIVWASDRLFRDVGMAKAFVDVMVNKKALLFDRGGYIPLETPDSRAAFYNAIVAAQHYREMCQVNSPRGIKKSLKKASIAQMQTPSVFGAGRAFQNRCITSQRNRRLSDVSSTFI